MPSAASTRSMAVLTTNLLLCWSVFIHFLCFVDDSKSCVDCKFKFNSVLELEGVATTFHAGKMFFFGGQSLRNYDLVPGYMNEIQTLDMGTYLSTTSSSFIVSPIH